MFDDMTLANTYEPITKDFDGSVIVLPTPSATAVSTEPDYPEVRHPGTGCRRHQHWDFDCDTCMMVMAGRMIANEERARRDTERLMGARA